MLRLGSSIVGRASAAVVGSSRSAVRAASSLAQFRSEVLPRFVGEESAGYVDGRWQAGAEGASYELLEPATGSHLATVADMGVQDTREAVAVATAAQKEWKNTLAKERAVLLRRWYDLMMANQDDLAEIISRESGKALAEAKGEIAYGAAFIEWYAEEGRRAYGHVVPTNAADRRIICIKQPIGVAALITPWNFPNAMIARKAGPALAAGCSVVIKPAEDTPLSALAMAQLATEAGIPDGVVNVVTAARQNAPAVGLELCKNKDVRALSFTGSTAVGQLLYEQCGSTTKRVGLELGGNAPFIVFDDADLDKAVAGAIAAKFRNTGQTCVCANRLMVQAGVYDAFMDKFVEAVKALKVGNPLEDGVQIGPVINAAAADKYEAFVSDATSQGAEVMVGGDRLSDTYFCNPTVLSNVTEQMAVFKNEIFGPIAPVFKFETEEEAVAMANASDVGLAGYFYSRDIGRAFRVAEALEVGMVGVNEGLLSTEAAPFGGVKESGIGREGGHWGLEEYMEVKYMCLGGL